MNNILVHNQTEIAANRAGGSFGRISGAHEGAHLGDGALAGDDHLHDRAGGDVGDEAVVERLALVLGVVGLGLIKRHHAQLHALDGQAGALEAVDDLADVAVAHTVGLDHAVGLLDSHDWYLSSYLLSQAPIFTGAGYLGCGFDA